MQAQLYELSLADALPGDADPGAPASAIELGAAFAFVTGVGAASDGDHQRVLPVAAVPTRLPGLVAEPAGPAHGRIAAVTCDRLVYRAEIETVHITAVALAAPCDARFEVVLEGNAFVVQAAEFNHGLATFSLTALPAGWFEVYLIHPRHGELGHCSFRVAEPTLPALDVTLLEARVDAEAGTLDFLIEARSFGQALEDNLEVVVVGDAPDAAATTLSNDAPGRFEGRLMLAAPEPQRLRLTVVGDPTRCAELSLSGPVTAARPATMWSSVSELFATGSPGAIAVRGTGSGGPFSVAEQLGNPQVLRAEAAAEDVVLIGIDLRDGTRHVHRAGDVAAGASIAVPWASPAICVCVGALVGGRPFEGFCVSMARSALRLRLEAPATIAPNSMLPFDVHLSDTSGPVRAIVTVMDGRTVQPAIPGTALAQGLGATVAALSAPFAEHTNEPLEAAIEQLLRAPTVGILPVQGGHAEGAAPPPAAAYRGDRQAAAGLQSHLPGTLLHEVLTLEGDRHLEVAIDDTMTRYRIDVFALSGDNWASASTTVQVEQPVRAEFELPEIMRPDDEVTGKLRLATASDHARVTLSRDGNAVETRPFPGSPSPDGDIWVTPCVLEFAAAPGRWQAALEDVETGERESVQAVVGVPGLVARVTRSIRFLGGGQALDREATGADEMRLLAAPDEPLRRLIAAAAQHPHRCCEQTAATVVCAALQRSTATVTEVRTRTEQVVVSGVARLRHMLDEARGFKLYPTTETFDLACSRRAVQHLWRLEALQGSAALPQPVSAAVTEALALADAAAERHGMQRAPTAPADLDEGLRLAERGEGGHLVKAMLDAHIDWHGAQPKPAELRHAVADRTTLAHAGAIALRLGDTTRGLALAEAALTTIRGDGALYSSMDSMAGLALLSALEEAEIGSGSGQVRLDDAELDLRAAVAQASSFDRIEVLAGVAMIETLKRTEWDWSRLGTPFQVAAGFKGRRRWRKRLREGEHLTLEVSLPGGYQTGDLVHIHLPPCLIHVASGVRAQCLSVDFAGQDAVTVPVLVTDVPAAKQHVAVCVRNMFQEERAASPPLLGVG